MKHSVCHTIPIRPALIIIIVLLPYFAMIACIQPPTPKVECVFIESATPFSKTADTTHGRIVLTSTYDTSVDITGYAVQTITLVPTDDIQLHYMHQIAYYPTDSSMDAGSSLVIDQSSEVAIVTWQLADQDVTIYLWDASSEIIDTFRY